MRKLRLFVFNAFSTKINNKINIASLYILSASHMGKGRVNREFLKLQTHCVDGKNWTVYVVAAACLGNIVDHGEETDWNYVATG